MKPRSDLISLRNNRDQISTLLSELVLQPRLKAIKWSHITRQTANIKIGYPGQHLASLITGMYGERTGARGNDLLDGSEVKSCSRIDQLDKCKDCGGPVARTEQKCGSCGSTNIKRNNDSKWLFTIRNRSDLRTLLDDVPRVVLILGDYSGFDRAEYTTLRFQAFEIWPSHERNHRFRELMTNYYEKIYLVHQKRDQQKVPAPKNFWPDQYQFYVCNPIRTFLCEVEDADQDPKLKILEYVAPDTDREHVPSVGMPASILDDEEVQAILNRASIDALRRSLPPGIRLPAGATPTQVMEQITEVSEELREFLELRDTDRISVAKTAYRRRRQ